MPTPCTGRPIRFRPCIPNPRGQRLRSTRPVRTRLPVGQAQNARKHHRKRAVRSRCNPGAFSVCCLQKPAFRLARKSEGPPRCCRPRARKRLFAPPPQERPACLLSTRPRRCKMRCLPALSFFPKRRPLGLPFCGLACPSRRQPRRRRRRAPRCCTSGLSKFRSRPRLLRRAPWCLRLARRSPPAAAPLSRGFPSGFGLRQS